MYSNHCLVWTAFFGKLLNSNISGQKVRDVTDSYAKWLKVAKDIINIRIIQSWPSQREAKMLHLRPEYLIYSQWVHFPQQLNLT